MTTRFRPPEPPNRTLRLIRWVLAALHVVLAGMLVYLRWGPIERALDRFRDQGAAIPAWMDLGLTVGTLLVAAFLLYRGLRAVRAGGTPSP